MVENYFQQELSDIVFEVESLEEWKQLKDELGLIGQEKVSKGKESPIPYPFMNTKLIRVAETLCPEKVSIKQYDKTPIPLEVMKIAAFVTKEKHFQEIQVWYDDKSPDPFLIGITGTYTFSFREDKSRNYADMYISDECDKTIYENKRFYSLAQIEERKLQILSQYPDAEFSTPYFSQKDSYLLARWGDQLKEITELTKLAIERVIEEKGASIRKDIADLTEKLNTLKTNAPLYIAGDLSNYDLTKNW